MTTLLLTVAGLLGGLALGTRAAAASQGGYCPPCPACPGGRVAASERTVVPAIAAQQPAASESKANDCCTPGCCGR